MQRLQPPIRVNTPLGEGFAYFICDDDPLQWQVFITRTGESWFFRNQHIRLGVDISSDVSNSPFLKLPRDLAKHIERYKQNGWL